MFGLCHGNALCVTVSGSCGVICLVAGTVKCVTCRFGARSCKHVEHVKKLIDSDNYPSSLLEKFANALTKACSSKIKTYTACQSSTAIPVHFSKEQQTVMKQSNVVRLEVKDGVSHLTPEDTTTCTDCGASNWSSLVCIRQCSVITEKELFSAKGLCE